MAAWIARGAWALVAIIGGAAIEGALGGAAIDRGQDDAGEDEDHHHPGRRREKQAGGERIGPRHGIAITRPPAAGSGDSRARARSG